MLDTWAATYYIRRLNAEAVSWDGLAKITFHLDRSFGYGSNSYFLDPSANSLATVISLAGSPFSRKLDKPVLIRREEGIADPFPISWLADFQCPKLSDQAGANQRYRGILVMSVALPVHQTFVGLIHGV